MILLSRSSEDEQTPLSVMLLLPRLAYPSRAGGGNERCGGGLEGGGGGAAETAETGSRMNELGEWESLQNKT